MRLQGIEKDDIVRCDIKGRRFLASVRLKLDGGLLAIVPLNPNLSHTRVTARQVIGHWRQTKATIDREAELARGRRDGRGAVTR